MSENRKTLRCVDLVPGSDPRFGVHLETTSPLLVFVRGGRQATALRLQFFRDGADVIRFKAATAADVANLSLIHI